MRVLLKGYCQGALDRSAIEEILGISRSRFFGLLKQYRLDPYKFSFAYQRETAARIPDWVEKEIEKEPVLERDLIDDITLPITTYNYSANRDRLIKHGVTVSLPTIIDRAKSLGCYQPHPRKKAHDREVVTTAIGALIQHDASHHRWSPHAKERWVLIASLVSLFLSDISLTVLTFLTSCRTVWRVKGVSYNCLYLLRQGDQRRPGHNHTVHQPTLNKDHPREGYRCLT